GVTPATRRTLPLRGDGRYAFLVQLLRDGADPMSLNRQLENPLHRGRTLGDGDDLPVLLGEPAWESLRHHPSVAPALRLPLQGKAFLLLPGVTNTLRFLGRLLVGHLHHQRDDVEVVTPQVVFLNEHVRGVYGDGDA